MKFCKPFYKKHKWLRYDELIPQKMVGGFYAWQRCSVCKKIKLAPCNEEFPQEPGWRDKRKAVDKMMGWAPKEYK